MTQLVADAAIQRFKENEERVDKFVNQDGIYVTNETSPREVETLPSFMERMHDRYSNFNIRGDWTTTTAYQVQDLVESGGIVYMSLEAHTSGTFATDLASGKWAVYQGITAAQLADTTDPTKGAGYLGHTYPPSSTGVELPGKPLTIIVRSSPIPLQSAISSNMVSDGSVDYSSQFQAAINYLRDYGGGKIILPPNKIIKAANLTLYSGIEIEGYDWTTVIKVAAGSLGIFVNPGSGGTTSKADNARNVALRGFKIKGAVDVGGFAEHNHLIGFSAVSYSEIVDMCVEGFQGDGINFGSGYVGGIERHNFRNKVIGGRIDGVNNDNRNGISVIDSEGLEIDGVEFLNCTRSNMPGAIDIEPDGYSYPIIKNIAVRNCSFENCGGNVGVVSVLIPAAVTDDCENITIENNRAKNNSCSTFVSFNTYRTPTATSKENDLKILNNVSSSGVSTIQLYSGKRVTVENNSFYDHTSGFLLGYIANTTRDVEIVNNRFVRNRSAGGSGMSVFNAHHVNLVRNKWIDCGSGAAGSSNSVDFQTGASSYIKFIENEFSSPTGKTLIAIQGNVGHTLDTATNEFIGNNLNGLPVSSFTAKNSDVLEQAYSPVAAGTGTAGTGTYTVQYSAYRMIGKTVFFRFEIDVAAGHTGTGQLQISLPVQPKGSPNNELRPIAIAVSGVTSTGGQIGLINPAAVVNGITGAIRCFYTGTGTLGQLLIPAGAFTVYGNGSYEAA